MRSLPLLCFFFLCCISTDKSSFTGGDAKDRAKYLLMSGVLPSELTLDSSSNILLKNGKEFRLSKDEVGKMADYFNNSSFAVTWKMYTNGRIDPSVPITQNVKSDNKDKPLLGYRIAIDPGHMAGNYTTARLERKSVQLKKDSVAGIYRNDTIIEGKLTLITALLLKKKLEALGAVVLLTREKDNHTSFGKTFDDWWKEDKKRSLDSAYAQEHITLKEKNTFLKSTNKKYVCREFFLQEDLRQRARMINAFDPDLAIIIHYNVDEKNEGWTKTSTKNYSMCFVPGAIFPGALQKKETRFNLLRLLISSHYSKSVKAAGLICEQFRKTLDVPLASSADANYLGENCIYTGTPGVFSRNLALTRLPHCPVVYGETLYQDNIKEFSQFTLSYLRSHPIPPRLEQVATAYASGILEYFTQ